MFNLLSQKDVLPYNDHWKLMSVKICFDADVLYTF